MGCDGCGHLHGEHRAFYGCESGSCCCPWFQHEQRQRAYRDFIASSGMST